MQCSSGVIFIAMCGCLFACAAEPDPAVPGGDPLGQAPAGSPLIGETGVTMAEYATAFVWISACQGDEMQEVVQHVSERLRDRGARAMQFKTRIDCINAAADCAAANRCDGLTSMPCSEDEAYPCEGSVQVSCDYNMLGGSLRRRDCASDINGNTVCADTEYGGFCTAPEACEGFETRCQGDRLIQCNEGVAESRDCTLINSRCVMDDQGSRCVSNAAPCTPCDGTVARVCDGDDITFQFDCGLFGLQCAPDLGNDGLPCQPTEPAECEGFAYRCTGDTAQICVGGAWMDWDCGAIGAECVSNDFHVVCRLPE